jgi:hypothetical protein
MPKPTQEHPDRLWLLLNGHVPRKRRNSQAGAYGLRQALGVAKRARTVETPQQPSDDLRPGMARM